MKREGCFVLLDLNTEFRDTNSLFATALGGSSCNGSDSARDYIFGRLYMSMVEKQWFNENITNAAPV